MMKSSMGPQTRAELPIHLQPHGPGGPCYDSRDRCSDQPIVNDIAANVGQPEVSTLEAMGETQVVQTKCVQ